MMMSRLKLEGVWSTNRLASSATGVASSNQVLIVVAVISPSMRESTLGQISAGKFTERPPLSENINSALLYQKIALKATYTTKKRISFFKDFSTGPGSALLPRYLLGTGGCGPGTPWSRAAVRCTMAARLEGGCGLHRPARVDALPDGPRRITHPIWWYVRCTCLGNAAPDCGAPDLPQSLFPAPPEMPPGSARPIFYLYDLLAPLCAYPPRFCAGAALVAARLAGGLGGEERGGRGQAPPLRVSVGRGGPNGHKM